MPLMFETSVPGVFAVGDVRSGSVKRVASAVGEGSVVISTCTTTSRLPGRRPLSGLGRVSNRHTPQSLPLSYVDGLMLRLWWNRLAGSYAFLTCDQPVVVRPVPASGRGRRSRPRDEVVDDRRRSAKRATSRRTSPGPLDVRLGVGRVDPRRRGAELPAGVAVLACRCRDGHARRGAVEVLEQDARHRRRGASRSVDHRVDGASVSSVRKLDFQ